MLTKFRRWRINRLQNRIARDMAKLVKLMELD